MKTLIISIYLISGLGAVQKDQAAQIFQEAKAVYASELGINLKLRRLRTRSDLFPKLNGIFDQQQRYNAWKAWLIAHGRLPTKAKHLIYMMVPPMLTSTGIRYIGGLAVICHKDNLKSIALGNAEVENSFGAPRLKHSVKIMEHEIGHQSGASHDDSFPNIMHPDPLPYVDSMQLHFSQKSKQEILTCMKL